MDGSNNLAFGISKEDVTSPAVADYTLAEYSFKATYLLVLRYNIVEGLNNGSAFLFVILIMDNLEPTLDVAATVIYSADVALDSEMFRQGTTGAAPNVNVDCVQVAKSWNQWLNVSYVATLSKIDVERKQVYGFNLNVFSYYDTIPAGHTTVLTNAVIRDFNSTQALNVATAVPGITTIQVVAENGINEKT